MKSPSSGQAQFVVASPFRCMLVDYAAYLESRHQLRFLALGTRQGAKGVSRESTRLLPAFGLAAYAATRLTSVKRAENFRYRLHPFFDQWVCSQLKEGDHLFSSYGYANASFRWVRRHGGKTLLDAGNSHPENFWALLSEEHRRWNCPTPPISEFHHRRAMEMMEHVDYVLAASSYVADSFLQRGFPSEKILRTIYPLDLTTFTPAREPRPRDRPLTIINTGSLSLRKGTPYLLEAFRAVQQVHPTARLLLTRVVEDSVRPILSQYHDLNIDWAPALPHQALAERLRQADLFVLPTLEEGFVRTAAEALACGVPVITTAHSGLSEVIVSGRNGEIVPIRSAQAVSDAILQWAEKVFAFDALPISLLDREAFSFPSAQDLFEANLRRIGLA